MNNFLSTVFETVKFTIDRNQYTSPAKPPEVLHQDYARLIAELKPVKIYIDTCSLLRPQGIRRLNELSVAAKHHQQSLIVFRSVIRELGRVFQRDSGLGARASPLLRLLYQLRSEVPLEIIEGSDKHFSDFNFLEAVVKDIRNMNVLIVSNDGALATSAKDIVEAMRPSVRIKYTVTTITF